MSAGIAAIVSGTTFATRRANTGLQADNAAQSAMNLGVATGQVERVAECTANAARISKGGFAEIVTQVEKDLSKASKKDKILQNLGKGAKFIGDNVNNIICVTSGVKILTSDDPIKESMVEIPGVALMLYGTEPLWKNMVGMSDYKRKNGKLVEKKRHAWFKNSEILSKQAEAVKDYCATKKFLGLTLKPVPSIVKGVGLALFSIGGYQGGRALGNLAADAVFGDENC